MAERVGKRKRESYSGEEVQGHDEKMAQQLLTRGLQQLQVSLKALQSWKTTHPKKQALVWLIRSSTVVSSDWISRQLGMGHRSNISRAIRRFERENQSEIVKLRKKLLHCKD